MPDTPLQISFLDESDLATLQPTNQIPTSLPRFEGIISCASPTSKRPLNLAERRKKFRKARLDLDANVTIQVTNTKKLTEEANNLLRSQYEARGYDTTFLNDEDTASEARLLTLLVKKGARASGTCSLLLDLPDHRLRADFGHLDCLNDLRRQGKYLIEICQLAAASESTNSTDRISLAALFSYIALCVNYFQNYTARKRISNIFGVLFDFQLFPFGLKNCYFGVYGWFYVNKNSVYKMLNNHNIHSNTW